MSYRYPVAMPDHSGNETRYLVDAMTTGWSSSQGPYVAKFEEAFAEWCGARYAVACSSGTAALTIALRALGIGPGDEVIVPEFTMVASAWAVTYTGATPVFVDCGDDLNINVALIEGAITPRTRAIMPVHVYGRPCEMDAIRVIAGKHGLKVVEDAAEAHGATYGGKKVGSIGDIGCFSLFANKIITSGEGGVCVTDDLDLYEEMIRLRGMYFNPDHTFLHPKVGYNFRMTNMQAAVACAQLERIDEFLAKRKAILGWYEEEIGQHMLPRPEGSVLWMADVVVDEPKRDDIRKALKAEGVETRVFFRPMSEQPMYLKPYGKLNAFAFSRAGFYLPSHTGLTKLDVKNICRILRSALA